MIRGGTTIDCISGHGGRRGLVDIVILRRCLVGWCITVNRFSACVVLLMLLMQLWLKSGQRRLCHFIFCFESTCFADGCCRRVTANDSHGPAAIADAAVVVQFSFGCGEIIVVDVIVVSIRACCWRQPSRYGVIDPTHEYCID